MSKGIYLQLRDKRERQDSDGTKIKVEQQNKLRKNKTTISIYMDVLSSYAWGNRMAGYARGERAAQNYDPKAQGRRNRQN